MPRRELYLFAGPSLGGHAATRLPGTLRPPAARGDVARLLDECRKPGVIALVDGLFDRELAVSHRELCTAIDRDWQLWGLSAIGAIRAYELRHEGMRGFGRVYQLFRQRADFRDDEVVHLHHPQPPYPAGSEPLIHLREALGWLMRGGAISAAEARRVSGELRGLWFGERTRERLAALLRACRPAVPEKKIRAMFAGFERFDVKARDLERFLKARPWQA